MKKTDAAIVRDLYPKIFFACHMRHTVDKDIKLTANQVSILDHLQVNESITLNNLATHMGITPATMSVGIDRLEKLGYVQRLKDKVDARRSNITLTTSGEKVKQNKSVLDIELVQAMLQQLNSKERKVVIDGLILLAQAAEMEMKNRSLNKSWNKRNV